MGALASFCGGCRAVDRGRGSQVESMASHRKMLIEILNYSGFIGGDSVSSPQCSGHLGGGAQTLQGFYSVPELLGVCATGCKFLLGSFFTFSVYIGF